MRVLSWNVHGLVGRDGRRDPERVARVIADARADVVALQEVLGWPGAPGRDPAEAVGALVGLAGAFGPTLTRAGRPYGNAILARHPIVATRAYDLSVPGREPRGCLRADLDVLGVRLHFFAAHLGLHWRERRRQAAQLLSADILRDAALAHPLVLAGDFNAWSNRSAVPRWLRRQLTDCALAAGGEQATFPARLPVLRLDRAYVDAAFRVLACEVISSPAARASSDHLPLVVELEPSPAATRPPDPRPVQAAGVTTVVRPR